MPERLPEAHRRPEGQHSNLNLKDTLFPLFKHKSKIALCAMGGLIAATAVYFLWPPTYESDAVLLVRYVLERSAVDPEAGASVGSAATKTNDTFINAEVAILKSWDLATQVAEALGPKRVLPDAKGTPTVNDAAGAIFSGLDVESTKNSNVILVSYSDRKPEVATLVLNELVNRYFTKHLEVHRSVGAFDFVSQQTDQVRARLNQTEDALKASKAKAGVLDIKDSTTSLAAEATKIEDELRVAQGDLAEQRARVKLMEGAGGVSSAPPSAPTATPATQPAPSATLAARPAPSATPATQPTNADIQQHQKLVALLDQLRHTELDLLSKYTSGSVQVKLTQSQIKESENQKQDLEKEFPSLAAAGPQAGEKAKLVGLEAKTEMLKAQLGDIQERIKQFADASPQIESLQRSKELEEANYKYFQGTLEKARVDEALDPSKMPNISAVQRPSPPSLVTKLRNKIALGLGGGAMALGVAFALLSELLFKQTLKRPLEIESRLGTRLLLSIPDQTRKALPWPLKRWRKKLTVATQNGKHPNLAPWEEGHFIHPYCEALRDRISLYFERNGMTHKPKLVGVTGFSEGAGTSTIAAGLAATFSEMGDGKVLLVNVNIGHAEAHQFFGGKPADSLNAALKQGNSLATAGENLYLATVAPSNDGPVQRALKRFFSLMPNLKASDFDYIIFDMPPLNQRTPTAGMAEYMDKVLVVVEAEKNNRDVVKRGYAELTAGRSNVSVVMNKVRSYLPKWLEADD